MPDDLDLSGVHGRHEPDPAFRRDLRSQVAAVVGAPAPQTTSAPGMEAPEFEPEELSRVETQDRPTRLGPPRPQRRPRGRWLLVAAAAAVVAVVGAVVVVAGGDDGDDHHLDTVVPEPDPGSLEVPRDRAELEAALLSPDLVWKERSDPMAPRHGIEEIDPGRRPVARWGFSHPCGNGDLVWPDDSAAGVTGVVQGYGFATHTVAQFQASEERTGEQRAETIAAIIYDAASACSEGTTTVQDVRCASAVFPICVVQRGPFVSVFQTHFDDGEDYLTAVAAGMVESMDTLTEGGQGEPIVATDAVVSDDHPLADRAVLTAEGALPFASASAEQVAEFREEGDALAGCLGSDPSERQVDRATAQSMYVGEDNGNREHLASTATVYSSEAEGQAVVTRMGLPASQQCYREVIEQGILGRAREGLTSIMGRSLSVDDVEVLSSDTEPLALTHYVGSSPSVMHFEEITGHHHAFHVKTTLAADDLTVDVYTAVAFFTKGPVAMQLLVQTYFTPFARGSVLGSLAEQILDRLAVYPQPARSVGAPMGERAGARQSSSRTW